MEGWEVTSKGGVGGTPKGTPKGGVGGTPKGEVGGYT